MILNDRFLVSSEIFLAVNKTQTDKFGWIIQHAQSLTIVWMYDIWYY